jgi:hypothetical protein
MYNHPLYLKILKDSPVILIQSVSGSIIARLIYLSGAEKFGYPCMYEFFPTQDCGFAPNFLAAQDQLQIMWVLFNMMEDL